MSLDDTLVRLDRASTELSKGFDPSSETIPVQCAMFDTLTNAVYGATVQDRRAIQRRWLGEDDSSEEWTADDEVTIHRYFAKAIRHWIIAYRDGTVSVVVPRHILDVCPDFERIFLDEAKDRIGALTIGQVYMYEAHTEAIQEILDYELRHDSED